LKKFSSNSWKNKSFQQLLKLKDTGTTKALHGGRQCACSVVNISSDSEAHTLCGGKLDMHLEDRLLRILLATN